MDDAQYLFRETARERKQIARGAGARRCGSKSKKCTLGTDRMTAAQIRKQNGECKVYNITKPMSWQQFRLLPKDLQEEYLRNLAAMGASRKDVIEMFGTTRSALGQYINAHHKGKRFFESARVTDNTAYKAWLKEKTEKPKEETPAKEQKINAAPPALMAGSVTYTGKPRSIFETILSLLEDGKDYKITVNFETK